MYKQKKIIGDMILNVCVFCLRKYYICFILIAEFPLSSTEHILQALIYFIYIYVNRHLMYRV